jgi:hypothetical protein
MTDTQHYDLNRKTFSTKIFILPNSENSLVPMNSSFGILVKKDEPLNLTCYASVGCNDINYDIQFKTNSTDNYQIKMNIPDRSKCLLNFNEISNFTKSIIFSSVNSNGTSVQCDIKFGPELTQSSAMYFIYFPSKIKNFY